LRELAIKNRGAFGARMPKIARTNCRIFSMHLLTESGNHDSITAWKEINFVVRFGRGSGFSSLSGRRRAALLIELETQIL
jgi:hypothetical protein